MSEGQKTNLPPKKIIREFVPVGYGREHTVDRITRGQVSKFVIAERRVGYTSEEEALIVRNREISDYNRCRDFFFSFPDLIPRCRWLPLDTTPGKAILVKSVRRMVNPLIADKYLGSSLDFEDGLAADALTETMREQLRAVLTLAKEGILKAMVCPEPGPGYFVPDLRGANFMFDRKADLRFVDTSSLDDVYLPEGAYTGGGLQTALDKLALIEVKYFGKSLDELLEEDFYQKATFKYRERRGEDNLKKAFFVGVNKIAS